MVASMKNSGQFFISGSYDVTAWDALDYATAEGDPDYLQAIISENRELWLLGKTSYEVWYNSGDSEFRSTGYLVLSVESAVSLPLLPAGSWVP